MLKNPDLHPGASINRWILAILTFHFDLVHVPGTHHGPDGLLCRQLQPGDQPNPPDNIDDWVDELYGFMHMINTDVPNCRSQQNVAMFVAEVADITLPSDEGLAISYSDMPRTVKAQLADERLVSIQKWLEDLERPADLSDAAYKSFV